MQVLILMLCAIPAVATIIALRRFHDVNGRSVRITRRGRVL